MNKKNKKHYVDSRELEKQWALWLETNDCLAWEKLQSDIYQMCKGIAVKFSPRSEEEHLDLAHETFVITIDKIKKRKLVFDPGRAPVFNLLTTTIIRHLFSFKNRENRRRRLLQTTYLLKPGVLDKVVCASSLDGNTEKHPDSSKLRSNVLSQLEHDKAASSSSKTKKKSKKKTNEK